MPNPDWMPVNPCVGCKTGKEMGSDGYGCNFNLNCVELPCYLAKVEAITKVFDWQLKYIKEQHPYAVGIAITTIESMLKQMGSGK